MIDLTRPLSSRTVADATVYPTMRRSDRPNQLLMGVFDGSGAYLPDSGLDRRSGEIGAEVPREFYDEDEPAVFPEGIYCGVLYFHFGHFLLESIARLWYAQQHPDVPLIWAGARNWYKGPEHVSEAADPRLPDGWVEHSKLLGWQKEMLDILGVTNPVAIVTRPTHVGKLHMPDIGYRYDDQFHPEHAAFLARYHGPEQDPESRLWLSRSGIGKAVRDLNAPTAERRLAGAGWDIKSPERQTLREQLDQMARASVVAGEEGSAFHLLMLLDDVSSKRFEIVRRHGREHRNMHTVGDAFGVDQRFTTLKRERVINAEGRFVTKVSEGSAELLNLLKVPVATPPEPSASAQAAATALRTLRAADRTIRRVLAVGLRDVRPLVSVGAPVVTVVSEDLEIDPRLPELKATAIYEMPSTLYFSSFEDATEYDAIVVDGSDPEAALRDVRAAMGASGSHSVWVIIGSSEPGLDGVWEAAAGVLDAFPGMDARTILTGENDPAVALLWFNPRGEPVALLESTSKDPGAPTVEVKGALHATDDGATAAATVTAARPKRPAVAAGSQPAPGSVPQLSVIVTSYNIEAYLAECLDSILNQTLTDIEIIVVDDGSSDSSPDIIRDYAARDSRIVPVIRGERSPGGVATAANAGLDVATAAYVGFADGDDVYEPEMFEKLLEAALEHDSDLAMSNYRLFTDDSPEREAPADERRWVDLKRNFYDLDDRARHTFLRFVAVPWRKLYRREFLESNAIRFPVGDYFFEDNPFHWFCLIQASSIALVPEVLCYHRVARAGQTMATADERLLRIFQHHATIYAFLEAKGKRDEFASTLLGWAMSQMEWISRKTPQNLHRALFDELVKVYDNYTEDDIERALVDGKKGRQTRNLSIAIARHNYARFVEVLKNKDDRRYPLPVRLFNHLRYSGVKKTAQMGVRFVNQRLRRLRG